MIRGGKRAGARRSEGNIRDPINPRLVSAALASLLAAFRSTPTSIRPFHMVADVETMVLIMDSAADHVYWPGAGSTIKPS